MLIVIPHKSLSELRTKVEKEHSLLRTMYVRRPESTPNLHYYIQFIDRSITLFIIYYTIIKEKTFKNLLQVSHFILHILYPVTYFMSLIKGLYLW